MAPDFFRPAVGEANAIIKAPQEGDEKLLAELSESKAWIHLKEIIEGTMAALSDSTKKSVGKAKSMEEIGLRYLIHDVSTDSFQSIIDIVELHKTAKYAEESTGKEE
jgi:hypothetical protein